MHWTIFAPIGSFTNLAAAAHGERKLDWTGTLGPEHDACTLSYAAAECADWLGRVAGVTATAAPWQGRIHAGPAMVLLSQAFHAPHRRALERMFGPIATPAAEQAFVIRTCVRRGGNPCYLVLGGSRIGALYGAYELLHRFGFRWFGPDAWDTDIPPALPRPLPAIRTAQAPSFVERGFWVLPRRGGRKFVLWMARNRLNLWSISDPDKPFCRKLGMKFIGGMHDDFARYVPPKKFFRDHPDWFGLRDGRRSDNLSDWQGDNLCLSHPGARRQFSQAMLADLIRGRARWADILNIMPTDDGHWCECANCRAAGNFADQLMLLVHDCRQTVQQALADGRLNRDVTIGAIAYNENKAPPTRPLPANFDHAGTMATFFPIERCYAHGFAGKNCSDVNAVLHEAYRAWTTNPACTFHGRFCVGEYYNVSKFAGLAAPFTRIMARDIPFFHRTGARAMHYMHVVVSDWGTLSLTNTQFAAQLWDHTLDCHAFVSDFLRRRYGAAASDMARFYRLLERAMANIQALKGVPNFESKDHLFHTLRLKGNPVHPVDYLRSRHLQYSPARGRSRANRGPSLLESVRLLDEAAAALDRAMLTPGAPRMRQRLDADARRFQYTKLMMNFYHRMLRVRMLENQGATEAAAQEARVLRDLGEMLRRENMVTRNGCQDSKVLFRNGLLASYLSQPYRQIMRTYGLQVPEIPDDGVR